MRKFVRYILFAVFLGIFMFSGYKLWSIYSEYKASKDFYDNMVNQFVTERDTSADVKENNSSLDLPDGVDENICPIEIDFEALRKITGDVVGWIYSEGTPIDYPIVQAEDNDYYLHRLFNGNYNAGGSLFMDYRNASDFSDTNSVVYGHNMKDHSMFGTLMDYKTAEYYAEHPIMYLLTPNQNYKVEIFAGCVTDYKSEAYTREFESDEEIQTLIDNMKADSTFPTYVEVTPADNIITLSTCSYEFDNARYVIFGKLVPIE